MTKPHLFIFQDSSKIWHGIKETPSGRASLYKPILTPDNHIKWKHDFISTYLYDYFEHKYALLDYTPWFHEHWLIKEMSLQ
jgi:hypothetical protein